MTEPTGGGLRLATHEAIILALLGKEPMAYNYGDDDDWCGLTAEDVGTYLETRPFILDHSMIEILGMNIDGFAEWGPFEAWDDECKEAALAMREEVVEKQAAEARDGARDIPASLDAFFAKYTTWEDPTVNTPQRLDCDERELESILDWECSQCRDDVGWCKFVVVERDDPVSEEIVIRSECGHCGSYYIHDATSGEQEYDHDTL